MRKIICALLALLLCCSLAVSVFAASDTRFLYDDADLLTQGQEAILTQKLADISEKYDAQIVIATLPSVNGSNIDYLLDYMYDFTGTWNTSYMMVLGGQAVALCLLNISTKKMEDQK